MFFHAHLPDFHETLKLILFLNSDGCIPSRKNIICKIVSINHTNGVLSLLPLFTIFWLRPDIFIHRAQVFTSMYPGCIAETNLFREKRGWFKRVFPLFMKYVTGGYVSEVEAGERLAQVTLGCK